MSDPNSIADFTSWVTRHIDLDWTVDFEAKTISGTVSLLVQRLGGHDKLLLDASDLAIESVHLDGEPVEFSYDQTGGTFGGVLSITPPLMEDPECLQTVKIAYSTTESCKALQWLGPEQTNDKRFPFLFSQCQAILARTLLPCQDTPSVQATYKACVRLAQPSPHIQVLMSANERRREGDLFVFEQTMAISSYLIAIAAGSLESRELSECCAIWSEPGLIRACAWEFAGTETFLKTAEALCGKYVWGRYDMLILPPSFPFGGMENPCLTFLTPSLLAKDRSLVSVVAHEITHSWTGNLVTNKNWEHFWLNEGFTKFIERKILGQLYGEPHRELLAQIGQADLQRIVDQFGPESNLARLFLFFVAPDDAFSIVPYEKGHAFLYYLEQLVGGAAAFDPYLRAHIKRFTGCRVDSEMWKNFLLDHFTGTEAGERLKEVNFDAWLYKPGMPPVPIEHDQSLVKAPLDLVHLWKNGTWDKSVETWNQLSAHQKIIFVEMLDKETNGALDHTTIRTIDTEYNLMPCTNVELALKWFMLCIRNSYAPAYQPAAEYATKHGRMKYCRPILRALYKNETTRDLALTTFQQHKHFYHPSAAQILKNDLQISS